MLRDYTNNELYDEPLADLRAHRQNVDKLMYNVGAVDDAIETNDAVTVTSDRMWLLSTHEIYGDIWRWAGGDRAFYNAEGQQYWLYQQLGIESDFDNESAPAGKRGVRPAQAMARSSIDCGCGDFIGARSASTVDPKPACTIALSCQSFVLHAPPKPGTARREKED